MRGNSCDSDSTPKTEEIHIVSSNAWHKQRAHVQDQAQNVSQFEPMTFSNTPFPVDGDGHSCKRVKKQVVPGWRYSFVACLVMVDLAVMLVSLAFSLWANNSAYEAIGSVMPFGLFLVCFSAIWVLSLTIVGAYHRHVMAKAMSCTRRSSMLRCSLLLRIARLRLFSNLRFHERHLSLPRSSRSFWK